MLSKKKVVLITGATGGIGAACSAMLASQGYQLVLHYHHQADKAKELASSLVGSQIVKYDLSQSEACEQLIKGVKREYGRLDILINNAGCAIDQIVSLAKPEHYDSLMSINLKPVFLLSKYASRYMIRQKQGIIINISSVVGHTGNAGQSLYSATKSAITGFTKSIALDLAPFGIRCNCVAPGFIQTAMTSTVPQDKKERLLERIPLKRFGTPQDIAHSVLFLASDTSAYLTGTTLHVNGGLYMN